MSRLLLAAALLLAGCAERHVCTCTEGGREAQRTRQEAVAELERLIEVRCKTEWHEGYVAGFQGGAAAQADAVIACVQTRRVAPCGVAGGRGP